MGRSLPLRFTRVNVVEILDAALLVDISLKSEEKEKGEEELESLIFISLDVSHNMNWIKLRYFHDKRFIP